MSVISVPSAVAELVGRVEGARLVSWEMTGPPPRDDLEVVVVPPFNAPEIANLAGLPRLRGIILSSAGYERAVRFLPPGVTLSNAVGVHDTATAEMALALILAAQRDLPGIVLAQREGTWLPQATGRALAESRVLVVGYGGIGRALTRRALACEALVTAVASRARDGDDLVDTVHASGDLDVLLPEADIVVLATPLNDSTRRMLDAGALALLPDDALVVNVGRGQLVDTDALVAECASGRLRAALDVTDPEPLPDGHPFWSTPNVLIAPHRGGNSVVAPSRQAAYVRSQIRTYLATGALDHVKAVGAREEAS